MSEDKLHFSVCLNDAEKKYLNDRGPACPIHSYARARRGFKRRPYAWDGQTIKLKCQHNH